VANQKSDLKVRSGIIFWFKNYIVGNNGEVLPFQTKIIKLSVLTIKLNIIECGRVGILLFLVTII